MASKKSNMPSKIKDLSDAEFTEFIRLAKKVLWADSRTHKEIQKHRVNIVPANFYSDIPLVTDIESSFEFEDLEEGLFASPRDFVGFFGCSAGVLMGI